MPNTSGPPEGAVLRAMIVFLDLSMLLLLLMPPPLNWAVLPEMVLLVTITVPPPFWMPPPLPMPREGSLTELFEIVLLVICGCTSVIDAAAETTGS